jgi:hypothetical protein
MDIGTS